MCDVLRYFCHIGYCFDEDAFRSACIFYHLSNKLLGFFRCCTCLSDRLHSITAAEYLKLSCLFGTTQLWWPFQMFFT